MNRVVCTVLNGNNINWLPRLEKFSLKVLDILEKKNWDISIALCNDATITEYNREFRKKNEPTDILSFESKYTYEDPAIGLRYLAGDIIISLDSLATNAKYFSVSMDEELRRLIIHGILHLDGRDHSTNDAEEPMLIYQEQLLSKLIGETITI